MGMQQRLAHEMKIEELYTAAQAVGKEIELHRSESALCTLCLGTEEAIEIAYVGYFKVAARNHRRVSVNLLQKSRDA